MGVIPLEANLRTFNSGQEFSEPLSSDCHGNVGRVLESGILTIGRDGFDLVGPGRRRHLGRIAGPTSAASTTSVASTASAAASLGCSQDYACNDE